MVQFCIRLLRHPCRTFVLRNNYDGRLVPEAKGLPFPSICREIRAETSRLAPARL